MEEKRPLRRQRADHHFGSLIVLAVIAGAFLLVTWVATKAVFCLSNSSDPLSGDWQRHVLASSGYLELGMLDDAAWSSKRSSPEDKTRTRSLAHRFLYMTARKWDMAAAVASHL